MYRSFFEFHSVLILNCWLFLHLINLILLSELIVSAIQKKKHLQFQENEKIHLLLFLPAPSEILDGIEMTDLLI